MNKVSGLDRFFYLVSCLFTFGASYILKTIIINAIAEYNKDNQ